MQLYLVKLPNFLGIDSRPFDSKTYDEEIVEEIADEEGAKRIRLKVENTIRWRDAALPNGEVVVCVFKHFYYLA